VALWLELVCDRCADVYPNGVGAAELRANAKRNGWGRRWSEEDHEMKDYCPRCDLGKAKPKGR
jgi:hypothetical protein